MSIRDNIKKVKKQMLNEVGETSRPTCDKVQELALRAINEGKNSPPWIEYMKLFVDPADNQQQLNRLLAQDGTQTDPSLNRARAYLIADGPCTPDTVLNFGNAASDVLDLGLDA